MRLLLYAITDGDTTAVAQRHGVGEAAIEFVPAAGLSAVVSRHEAMPGLSEDTIWAFERVIESLMATGAVLPARFGTLLADDAELTRTLEARRPELVDSLHRVRGAVELSLRGHWSAPIAATAAEAPRTGIEYMRARAEPHRRAGELAARIRAHLDEYARESRHQILSRESMPVSSAFLVDRAHQDAFLRAVRALETELTDAELVCTGPWPAYSFVGEAGDG
jgi:hypothetical protein